MNNLYPKGHNLNQKVRVVNKKAMNKRGLNFWDILAWVVLAGIFIWILLKAFGFFDTPILIEYAPYFGAIYIAGWAMHKLETAVSDVKDLKRFKDDTIREINKIKTNCVKKHSE